MGIPVIMYHALGGNGLATGTQQYDDADYTLGVAQFSRQMTLLKERGFRAVSFDEIADLDTLKFESDTQSMSALEYKPIIISFDDGHASDADSALPILLENNFQGTFFITTDWIGQPGYLNKSSIRALSDAGMTIGSHGASHAFFNDMLYAEAKKELDESLAMLRDITGREVHSFSAPGGQLPKDCVRLMQECGVKYVCTSSVGTLSQKNFPLEIPRVPMRQDLSDDSFCKIVGSDPAFYRKALIRSTVLGSIRRVIGNDLYMSIRERLA